MAQSLCRFAARQLMRLDRGQILKELLENGTKTRGPWALYSTDNGSRVLSHSTILLQDGLDIQELPLVMRRMDAREFPFTTAMYTGEALRKVTEQDTAFQLQLSDAVTLRQVFSLLEVPGDRVTAYSAAFALQRLCGLQEGRDKNQSFIRRAILNELCETVVRDLHTLTNDTLIGLIKCYLITGNYEQKYVESINSEVEKRIGDGLFSIDELCTVVDLLSSWTRGSQELANNVWIHIGNRYGELDHNNLPRLFQSLKYLPPSQRFLWKLIDKRVMLVWWKLDPSDIALVMRRMTLCNHFHGTVFSMVGKWLLTNIHDVKDSQLKDIIAAYTHFNFSDTNVVKSLERYVSAKASTMDKTLLAVIMEHCRRRRCISTRIFDAVALDFQQNGHKYGAHEILNALRPFGQLNYVPPNATQLFLTIEDVLSQSFSDFDAASIVELLTSFVYIERFPINFLRKIFTPHFLSKVRQIPHEPIRHRTGRYLMELQAAIMLESPKQYIKPLGGDSLGLSLTWLESRYFKLHVSISKSLAALLGSGHFYEVEVPKSTPHIIDFQINVGSNGRVMKATRDSQKKVHKCLALIGMMPDHYCVNTQSLVGEQAMKQRHLSTLGYTVVEIPYEAFMWRCQTAAEKANYLKQLLTEHVDLSIIERKHS